MTTQCGLDTRLSFIVERLHAELSAILPPTVTDLVRISPMTFGITGICSFRFLLSPMPDTFFWFYTTTMFHPPQFILAGNSYEIASRIAAAAAPHCWAATVFWSEMWGAVFDSWAQALRDDPQLPLFPRSTTAS